MVAASVDLSTPIACDFTYPRLATARDGTLFVAVSSSDPTTGFLFRVPPGSATAALVRQWPAQISGLAAGIDGSVYLSMGATIERITADGAQIRFAGNGAAGRGGDGLAIDLPLAQPGTLALTAEGSLIFIEGGAADGLFTPRVRRVGSDGYMATMPAACTRSTSCLRAALPSARRSTCFPPLGWPSGRTAAFTSSKGRASAA